MCESLYKSTNAHLANCKHSDKINDTNSNQLFAALKILEQLCIDGKLSKKDFAEILIEYADKVDTGKFMFNSQDKKSLLDEVMSCTT